MSDKSAPSRRKGKNEKPFHQIALHYERCLKKYGDTHKGVDWPDPDDAMKRYEIMLGVMRHRVGNENVSLLDLGCGAAHLLDYIHKNNIEGINYSGVDISAVFIELCREKHPEHRFYHADILEEQSAVPDSDYVIMNGVFTEKLDVSHETMLTWFERLLGCAFKKAHVGVAFNIMSKHVEWERDDLFYLSFDDLTAMLCKRISRHFIIRQDYGLFEYTVYLYKAPYVC